MSKKSGAKFFLKIGKFSCKSERNIFITKARNLRYYYCPVWSVLKGERVKAKQNKRYRGTQLPFCVLCEMHQID